MAYAPPTTSGRIKASEHTVPNSSPKPSATGGPGIKQLYLPEFFPYHLSVTADLLSGELAGLLHGSTGLSLAEWRVFAVIGSFAPLSTKTVAAYTTMSKVAVSRAVARLLSIGYLVKETEPEDNRLLRLSFSDLGRQEFDTISRQVVAWSEQILQPFSTEEIRTMQGLLARLRQRISDVSPMTSDGRARKAFPPVFSDD